jgi:hypothetical protein
MFVGTGKRGNEERRQMAAAGIGVGVGVGVGDSWLVSFSPVLYKHVKRCLSIIHGHTQSQQNAPIRVTD